MSTGNLFLKPNLENQNSRFSRPQVMPPSQQLLPRAMEKVAAKQRVALRKRKASHQAIISELVGILLTEASRQGRSFRVWQQVHWPQETGRRGVQFWKRNR
ncbi:hypothetical protein Pyn_21294 [Prunus yedoensis var. nudiflora]|uniref:Uncharacterized protein n=1 Tax=Prunus yedoensis var. nudiflora TaxID=2094558 RepID=A0A314U978_PRUYE|nr:hypothetical protein Pyn_21294 [Prunus yedoensis var. nudiflora]